MVRAARDLADRAEAVAERIVERSAAQGDDVVIASPPTTPAERADRVAEALLRADEAFGTLALTDATRALADALEAADDDGLRSREVIVELWLLSAMLDGALGEPTRADEAAREALAIEPTLVIDPARYPPTLAARIEALRPGLTLCTPRVSLDPADATLVLDGEVMPTVPAQLACGVHWITASRAGYVTTTRRWALAPDADAPEVLALALDPAGALASVGPAGTPIDPLVERGAAALGRDLLVLDLVTDPEGGLRASLGARSIRVSEAAPPDEIAAALLAPLDRGLDSGVVIGVGVGIGAVVAAAVAIALAVALAPSSPPGWTAVGEVVRP